MTTTLAVPGEAVAPNCPKEDGSSPRRLQFTDPPPECFDLSRNWLAILATNRGDIEITLDSELAPNTVNNFIFLALWHYYDGSSFWRVIPDFGIQGGDPIDPASQDGGPGYTIPMEPPPSAPYYPRRSVQMADTTHGSQFLIVTGPKGEALPPETTRFGSVTAGFPVLDEIAATGTEEGTPTEPTIIEEVIVGVRE